MGCGACKKSLFLISSRITEGLFSRGVKFGSSLVDRKGALRSRGKFSWPFPLKSSMPSTTIVFWLDPEASPRELG